MISQVGSPSYRIGNFWFSLLLVMVFSKTLNAMQSWAEATRNGCRSRFWSHRVLPGSPKTLRPYLWWMLLALPGIKLKICRAESPVYGPLMVGLIGVSDAGCPFIWLRQQKAKLPHFFLFPGLTRSQPKEMNMFELCLHHLARKRGLISATKVSVWFVLKWDPTSGIYPRATSYCLRDRKAS